MKKIQKQSLVKKIIVVMMAVIMIVGIAFQATQNVNAAITTIADADTSKTYEDDNFLGHEYSTEFAGRIWTDKTVTETEDNNFTIKYSALATSKAVTGQTNAPVDVVFVIDTSGSMMDPMSSTDDTTRIVATIDALNDSIEEVMSMNDYTRVAVVAFSEDSEVLLPLGRYEKGSRRYQTGYGQNSQYVTVNDYFSVQDSKMYKHVIPEGGNNQQTDNRSVIGGTNIQYGYYEGLRVLSAVTSTTANINGTNVNRVPALIFLSDGAPTLSSSSDSWWAPSENSDDGPGSNPSGNSYYIGNGMKALMTAAYMKEAVNRKYANDISIYTIGMGISHLKDAEKNLAYVTLAPNDNWNANNNVARDFRSAWATYITNNGTPRVNVGASTGWNYYNVYYTITHPTGDAAQYDIDTNVDALKNLVKDYYDADDADAVTNVFDTIVSDIALSVPEVPTEVKTGETLATGGHLTYTDPIGHYMELKGDTMRFKFEGNTYTVREADGNGEFTFDNDPSVMGSDGQEHKLNLIDITLTSDANGFQTLVVDIPAVLIPLRVNEVTLSPDGKIVSHTHNGELPCELTYTVGLISDIYDADTNSIRLVPGTANGQAWTGEKLTAYQEYLKANADGTDGTVKFYSNLFTGTQKIVNNKTGAEHTVGDANVTFEPAHTNAFYYIQEKVYVYADKELTTLVTADALDDDTTYYYKEEFYHEDDIEPKAVVRTGQQLKAVELSREEGTGYWYREPGSVRKNKLQLFENQKTSDATGTAQDYYASEFVKTGETDHDGYFKVHLGNNGVLKAKVSGNLRITKEVTADAGLTAPDKEFTFTVDLRGADGVYSFRILDESGQQISGDAIEDGDKIVLKAGQSAVIENLPAGIEYSITEETVAGFRTVASGDEGEIISGQTAEAVFTNHYSATPVVVNENDTTVDFGVQKVIAGDRTTWNSQDKYTFILESNRATTPMPTGAKGVPNDTNPTHKLKEVIVTDGDEFAFGEITFNAPGTYTYTISERVDTPGIAGISYSGAMYQVVVVVSDNGAGVLSKAVTMTKIRNDQGTATGVEEFVGTTAVFTNTFDADHVEWTPVGTKDYTDHSGSNPLRNGMFTFNMKVNANSPANTPMPTSAVNGVTTDTNIGPQIGYDSIVFGPEHIADTNPGKEHASIYLYDFTEDLSGTGANAENNYTVNGMTYDANTTTVKVYVYYNEDMEIIVEPEYPTEVEGTHYNRVVFFNEYTAEPATIALEGSKTLSGREWKEGDSFTFALGTNHADTMAAITAGDITGINSSDLAEFETVEAEQADFTFGSLTFTKPGTYRFRITEKEGAIAGITYDAHVTTVTVTVVDDNGQLVATATYNNRTATTNADQAVTTKAVFTNVYGAAESAPINLSGTKTLSGRDMRANEFFINIEPQLIDGSTTERAPLGDSRVGNPVPAAPKDTESAPVTLLNNVVYTAEGTYVYLIKEHIPSDNQKLGGITYDENTVYRVTVTVEDNKDGKLIATPVIEKSTDKGASWDTVTAQDIKFNNSYAVEAVTYSPIHLWKNLEGKELQDGEFSFKMEEVKDDVDGMTLPAETTVKNKAAGEIVFEDIRFTKAGTYQVKVTEVIPDENEKNPGITYSDNELVAQFDVIDNGYGSLEITRSIVSGEVIFTNTYASSGILEGKTNLKITKNFTGRANDEWLTGDAFEFTLEAGDDDTIAAVNDGYVTMPTNKTITVDKDNKDDVYFGDITFIKEGTYQFTVTETRGNIAGVTYDTTPRTVIVNVMDQGNGSMAVALASGSSTLTFNNSYNPAATTATLEGVKKISGRDWMNTDIFEFTLGAVDNAPLPDVVKVENDANGKIAFAPITYDEAGTYVYEIKETGGGVAGVTDATAVVTATVTVEDKNEGALKVTSVVYSSQEGNGFVYTNRYTTTPTDGVAITGLKVVSPTAGNSYTIQGQDFTFEITPGQNNPGNDPIAQAQVKNAADGTIEFATGAVYRQKGEYEYTIREIAEGKAGIGYDDTEYTVTVNVSDDEAAAKLKATVTITKAGAAASEIVFDNSYTPNVATAVLYGEKVLESDHTVLEADQFQFKLEASGANAANTPMPESGKEFARNNVSGTFQFGTITYTAVGEYTYQISEVNEGKRGYTYDDNKHIVTVTVTDEGGQLEANVSGLAAVVFTNEYTPDSVTLQGDTALVGKKKLDGRGLAAGEFEFQLLDKNNQAVATAKNDAKGNFKLEPLTFTEAGTFYYTIVETNNQLGGVTYDEAVYTVQIDVTDAGGYLEADVIYLKNSDETDVVFENKYQAATVGIQISAAKTLKGRQLKEGEFTFLLKDAAGQLVAKATNDAKGLVVFEEITYDAEGTYEYTISEEKGNAEHVKYDETVYKVTVTVTDNQKGAYEAEVDYGNANPVFINTFDEPKSEIPTGDFAVIIPTCIMLLMAAAYIAIYFKKRFVER